MGIKKFLGILILTIAFFFSNLCVQAQIVRVGISNQSFSSLDYSDITLFALSTVYVYDKESRKELLKLDRETNFQISLKDGKYIISTEGLKKPIKTDGNLLVVSPTGWIGVYGLKRAGKQAYYRGQFEILKSEKKKDRFYLVNVLDSEEYLRGVVPNEMPVSFGLQALKAQTVAARNYVLSPRTKAYKEFDVNDSVASQVYFGANTEKALSNQAITETNGIVALYDWNLILAQYSSTAGGYTEYYDNVYGDAKRITKPYLVAVPDNPEIKPLRTQEDVREFYMNSPKGLYDSKSPYYRWTREWTKAELEDVLVKNLPKYAGSANVVPEDKDVKVPKDLQDITIKKHGISGKIIEMEVVFKNNKYKITRELVIRRIFTKDGRALPSANVYFDKVYSEGLFSKKELDTIIAYGGGFGHGVGMSQYGAGYMATELKMPYSKILRHYYTDISLATMPVEISNNDSQRVVSQKFFANQKSARLVINNKFQIGKILVNVNGKEVMILLEKHILPSHKFDAVDISKYIKKGENIITYSYPKDEGNNKAVKVYVELTGEDE